jgi:galactokinase/mevalonate kinase-like predicted kinase
METPPRHFISWRGCHVQGLETLGQLMLGSHWSCAQQHHCSCEELDTLVELATKAGAKGGRLTGTSRLLLLLLFGCQVRPNPLAPERSR